MPPEGGTRTPINPSVVARISGALGGAIRGASEAWFGPLQPIPPQAPPDVAGRQFDYPIGFNLQYRPKSEYGQTGIDYQTLRALSDPTLGGLDLVRLAIETRKDIMAGQKWTIRPFRETGDASPATPQEEELARSARLKFRRPDGLHTFRTWQRMIMEEMLVVDATTVYLAPTPGGGKKPEVIDGTTIKRLLDAGGRQPLPPDPAYQQSLKGLPAVNYNADELIVAPRNVRVERAYGFSPVEQIVTTVNIALRRQLSQLEYYTAGSVPDVIFGVPDSWTTKNIQEFQQWWDSILSGDTAERRRARFVPGGVKPFQLKPDQLKDGWDEWLARIICWCFSLSPGALVRDQNRATAETAKQEAMEQGLEPIKLWFADLMNEIVSRTVDGGDGLEFAYQDEEVVEPETKARVFQISTGGKPWMTADEVRSAYGMQPLTPEQKAELEPPAPPFDPVGNEPEPTPEPPTSTPTPPPPTEKAADIVRAATDGIAKAVAAATLKKATPSVKPINHDRAEMKRINKQIAKACGSFFEKLGNSVADAARGFEGAQGASTVVEGASYDDLRSELSKLLSKAASSGSRASLLQVFPAQNLKRIAKREGRVDPDLDEMLSLANEKGIEWADVHAAELVGMHRNSDGSYSPSDNNDLAISKTTRDAVNALVKQAMEEGWSNDDLADELEELSVFSQERSDAIARTETAFADLQGNRIGWRESGVVVGRKWAVAQDEVCPDCLAMDGLTVGIDENFEPTDAPLHPNCRCDELPILAEDDEEAEKVARRTDARTIEKACQCAAHAVDELSKRLDKPLVAPDPSVVVFERDKEGRIVGARMKPSR